MVTVVCVEDELVHVKRLYQCAWNVAGMFTWRFSHVDWR